ncbi:retrotransposon protein [Pyrus ussuriensis x Pyrus communis]|uniref:Retrotransposon protein n=1 Tax=Pyrus ussuriensis x Pyrus communis TaxID=2448454 RepID=A0A5N5GII9_9ROSA|nr:retrotransposon protein [Pyrus ussuriensis x Pyrus communis]
MWQCEVKDVLIQQGLLVVLEDMPMSMKKEEWQRLNAHACSTIRLCLGKAQKFGVMNISSAKELWDTLESKYLKKSAENRLYLKSKLYRFQYKEGTKMIDHLEEFNKMIAELLNLEKKIKDEDKALILMNSLLESYESFVTTWIYGRETINFDEISSAVMNHEVRNLDRQERNNYESLMVRGRSKERKSANRKKSKSRTRGNSSNRKFLDKDECAFCHEKGHWKQDCPKIKAKNKERKYEDSEANIVEAGDEDFVCALTAAESIDYVNQWVLDTGCTHITRTVYMGDDNPCSTQGIRSVMIKHHDGVVRELQGVARGALVIMKAPRRGLLYLLEGKTMEKQVAIVAEGDQEDTYSLWHMRTRMLSMRWSYQQIILKIQASRMMNKTGTTKKKDKTKKLWLMISKNSALPRGEEKEMLCFLPDSKIVLHELVELPKGRKVIGCKWVYAKKNGIDHASPVRFKARLVAKGYAQKEGVDYNEIFSLVMKHSSIRILLALVAQFDLELVQLDVKTAFLHGNLSEEIYIRQPEGYEEQGKKGLVCKLNKFDKFMKDQDYTRSHYDYCVYHKKLSEGTYVYLLIYVDDMLIAFSDITEITKLKAQMQKEFEMKDLVGIVSRFMHNPGKLHWDAAKWILRYLQGTRNTGICFEQDDGEIDKFSIGYADSDFASDLDKRRSTTGQSAIYLAKYQVHHARTKHIDVQYHFVREIIAEGEIRVKKIATTDNPADMLTKVVDVSNNFILTAGFVTNDKSEFLYISYPFSMSGIYPMLSINMHQSFMVREKNELPLN